MSNWIWKQKEIDCCLEVYLSDSWFVLYYCHKIELPPYHTPKLSKNNISNTITFFCLAFSHFVNVWMTVCFPPCRRAVHRWRDQKYVHQSAQTHCIPGRVPRLPGLCGPEWETPRPDCRCPPQGGSGGTRLRRWVMRFPVCRMLPFKNSSALSTQKELLLSRWPGLM